MNTRSRTRNLCAGALVAMAAVASTSAQIAPRAGGFETLSLTIRVPEREFLVLEPVPITLRLENRTGRPVFAHTVLEFSAGRMSLLIAPEGSAPYEVEQLSMLQELVGVKPAAIPPGAARQIDQVLDFNLDQILPGAGKYRMQAVLRGSRSGEAVRSNIVIVVLREPNGYEQAAQKYIEGTGAASYFFTGSSEGSLYAQLEEFASAFGGTTYSDYAYLRLGEINLARRDNDAAREYLSKVALKHDFPLAARAQRQLMTLAPK